MIETLFPPGVVVVRATEEMADVTLLPEERADTGRMSPERLREFALGRACARRALERLGLGGPVRRGPDRAPVWPEGVVGTITHTDALCAAAVARHSTARALGLDAEQDTPLSARAAARICTEAERAHLGSLPAAPACGWPKVVFSAKESFYKAWYTIAATGLGFRDVELRFDPEGMRFEAVLLRDDKPGPRRAEGRFALEPPHVLTAVVVPPE